VTYTLTTFALWFVAAALVGLVVGWLLGRLRPARYVAPDESFDQDVDDASDERTSEGMDDNGAMPSAPGVDSSLEAEHYAVLTRLEQVTAERDELRRQVAQSAKAVAPVARVPAAPSAAKGSGDSDRLASELRVRLWNAEATITELREQLRAAEGEQGAGT